MQSQTVYLKIPKEIKTSDKMLCLKEIAKIYCPEKQLETKLKDLPILNLLPKKASEKVAVSYLCVVKAIKTAYPEIEIENIGETDFVVNFKENGKETSNLLEWGKTALVCLILFFGAAFTIMAFNTDVSAKELFSNIYILVTGTEGNGRTILEASYCVGLPIGIIIFFDHFKPAARRQDPTPMEVQMRSYEEDACDVLIQNAAREGHMIEHQQSRS